MHIYEVLYRVESFFIVLIKHTAYYIKACFWCVCVRVLVSQNFSSQEQTE